RALEGSPAVLEAWFDELAITSGQNQLLDTAVARLKREFSDRGQAQYRARNLIEQLALTLQASLLLRGENQAVAEAFIASRLGLEPRHNYGSLPRGADMAVLLQRADPWQA